MNAHKIKVNIPADHKLIFNLPENFPTGPAEVIVLTHSPSEKRIVKLGGILTSNTPPSEGDDPIADALQELRRGRIRHFETLESDVITHEDV